MSLLFINNTQETFTPTASGAIATIISECCQVAARNGQAPTVITRSSSIAPFSWPATIFVDYPSLPGTRLGVLVCRADRKIHGWRYFRQRQYAQRVVTAIARHKLQHQPMVLVNDPELAVVLRWKFPGARIVHWFQNQQECKPKYRRLFSKSVDAVAACSNFTARWIEGHYGLAPQSVRTIYNGVNCESFSPAAQKPDGVPVVNFVGRTGIEKGPDLLLKAALRIAEKNNRFAIQMIGSNHWDRFELDEYQKMLSKLVSEVEGRGIVVRRPGHIGRAALPDELRKAHIHVVPARWDEPFGMTTIEGMACGLATIASRTGGTPEVIDGQGIFFERESVAGLSQALGVLLSDQELCEQYSLKARARAMQFSWQRVWNGLSELAA